MLTESQREAAFPVTIDLGRKDSVGMPTSPMMGFDSGKSSAKERIVYPTLYIDSVPGLENLPKEGCILIKYRRKELTLQDNEDGEDTTGAKLEIQSLCLPKDMAGDVSDSEEPSTLEDAFKKLKPGEVAADAADYAEPAGEEEE